jgi:hypothetical protein
MAKISAIIGLVFTIGFTVIMANYTYHAWLELQDAEKDVKIAQQEYDTAVNEYNQAYSEAEGYELAGHGGVVDSR